MLYRNGASVQRLAPFFLLISVAEKTASFWKMKQLFFKKSSTPVQQKPMPSLTMCLLMDLLGFAFLSIPFLGPFVEALFAPVSAIMYWRMFGFRKGFFGGIFNFVEELIPGLDLIPTFTITWLIQYFKRRQTVSYYPVKQSF